MKVLGWLKRRKQDWRLDKEIVAVIETMGRQGGYPCCFTTDLYTLCMESKLARQLVLNWKISSSVKRGKIVRHLVQLKKYGYID